MTDRSKKTILLIGDDPALHELLTHLLREFDVLVSQSAVETYYALDRLSPDLAIIDSRPAGLDGHDVCRHIRQGWANGPKIILLTEDNAAEARLSAYEAGADDCVMKPFAPQEMIAKCRIFARLVTEEQLGRLKTQLLDMVAHELRTPLTGIIVAAETLTTSHADEHHLIRHHLVE